MRNSAGLNGIYRYLNNFNNGKRGCLHIGYNNNMVVTQSLAHILRRDKQTDYENKTNYFSFDCDMYFDFV